VETKRRPRSRQLFIIFESLVSLNVLENVPEELKRFRESVERANEGSSSRGTNFPTVCFRINSVCRCAARSNNFSAPRAHSPRKQNLFIIPSSIVLEETSHRCARDVESAVLLSKNPTPPSRYPASSGTRGFHTFSILSNYASRSTGRDINRRRRTASLRNIQDFRPSPRAGGSKTKEADEAGNRRVAAVPSPSSRPASPLFRQVATDISEAKHASFADAPRTLQINEMSF